MNRKPWHQNYQRKFGGKSDHFKELWDGSEIF